MTADNRYNNLCQLYTRVYIIRFSTPSGKRGTFSGKMYTRIYNDNSRPTVEKGGWIPFSNMKEEPLVKKCTVQKILSLSMALLLTLSLAACGGGQQSSAPAPTPAPAPASPSTPAGDAPKEPVTLRFYNYALSETAKADWWQSTIAYFQK